MATITKDCAWFLSLSSDDEAARSTQPAFVAVDLLGSERLGLYPISSSNGIRQPNLICILDCHVPSCT